MLKKGCPSGQTEHLPLMKIGFVNGHSTIVGEDFIRSFWADLKSSKSFIGDNKFGASEFVKNIPGMH